MKINRRISSNIELFEQKINYEFKNKEYILEALTHSSYSNENKNYPFNERLEFLGDSVLSIVISDYLFKKETKLGKYAYSTRLNIISMEGVARLKENAVREIPVQEQDTTVFPEEKTAIKENMPKQTLEESFDVMDCTQPGTELPL